MGNIFPDMKIIGPSFHAESTVCEGLHWDVLEQYAVLQIQNTGLLGSDVCQDGVLPCLKFEAHNALDFDVYQ
jgi:hypothetical protein